ncbi:tyrosine--tRNA ligase, putative [Hepatocystis sp. ex Piliocolobus tephrosceles]|nr:tyrosine--tRNA ligase, putative [Hepatocystis sp. ex Piliocolobus tephrosceles]
MIISFSIIITQIALLLLFNYVNYIKSYKRSSNLHCSNFRSNFSSNFGSNFRSNFSSNFSSNFGSNFGKSIQHNEVRTRPEEIKSNALKKLYKNKLIHYISDIKSVDNILYNNEKENERKNRKSVYVGIDLSCKYLHIGNLVPIITLDILRNNNTDIVIVLGKSTTKIGDPSFQSAEREKTLDEEINENEKNIKYNIISLLLQNELNKKDLNELIQNNVFYKKKSEQSGEKEFIYHSKNKGSLIILSNNIWYDKINIIDFLKYGKYFSINKLLKKEAYLNKFKKKTLTLKDLNYITLQAYDYLYLFKTFNTVIQIGGSDQWSNIQSGIELCQHLFNTQLYGLTTNLLIHNNNIKYSKSSFAENKKLPIWVDKKYTPPYLFWNYLRNINDNKVDSFVHMLTNLKFDKYTEVVDTVTVPTFLENGITDKVITDKVINDKVINDKVINGNVINGNVINGNVINGKVINGKVINGKVINGKAINDKVIADHVIADKVIADHVIADKVIAHHAIADKDITDKAINDKIIADNIKNESTSSNPSNNFRSNTNTLMATSTINDKIINEIKKKLADHVTSYIYGTDVVQTIHYMNKIIKSNELENLKKINHLKIFPFLKISLIDLNNDKIDILFLLKKFEIATTNKLAKEKIKQKCIYLNNFLINDYKYKLHINNFIQINDANYFTILKTGKKKFYAIVAQDLSSVISD